MAIMAGMLPGVESARRRRLRLRLRQSGASSSGEAAAALACGSGARRPSSSCLYHAGGHDVARLLGSSSSSASKGRSSGSACEQETLLDSNAREAKERLDQKLRWGQRESAVAKSKRHPISTPATPDATGSSIHHHRREAAAPPAVAPCPCVLRREVFSEPPEPNKQPRRRFSCWLRLGGRRRRAEAEACEKCAVCLEELRAGDVVARLPCAHRFHWPCAVPWVLAASRCPVCRARAHLGSQLASNVH